MRMSTWVRRTVAAFATAGLVVVGTITTATAADAALPASSVTRMAALGDSITQALMTCSIFSSGCPANSWSTGTNTKVNSQLLRLRAAAGNNSIVGYNDSVTGAASAGLNTQAQKAVSSTQTAQYITIEIGANDACTKTVAAMTSTGAFQTNVHTALATLAAALNHPQIFVASIPSLQRLYDVNKANASARFAWSLFGICQSMLANPTSTLPADVARRTAVQQRVNDYNAILSAECAAVANCRYDGGAVATYMFAASDIGTTDYFHPSLAGQATLASITWPKTQWVS